MLGMLDHSHNKPVVFKHFKVLLSFDKCRFGMAGERNVQGEKVKKLDVIANQLMINMLRSSYTTCVMVSEENESAIEVDLERQVTCLLCML